jgi:hypothetical protein
MSTAILAPKRKEMFLDEFRKHGNVSQACRATDVPRRIAYRWKEEDEEFAVEWEEAKNDAGDALEQEARRRAVDGIAKPIWYKGEYVGSVHEFSDTLLIFLLKGAKPHKYADRFQGELTGGMNLQINYHLPEGAVNPPEKKE